MTDYIPDLFNSETVNSGGGSVESSGIECFKKNTLTVQVVGDGNSSNLDVSLQAKLDENGVFGDYTVAQQSEDLTSNTNNSKFYTFDVSDVNDARLKIKNEAGNDTVIDALAGVSENNEG